MSEENNVFNAYARGSSEYVSANDLFLRHATQRKALQNSLETIANHLSRHELFVHVDSGDGMLTSRLAQHFTRTIALEENEALFADLERRYNASTHVEAVQGPYWKTDIDSIADFVVFTEGFLGIERSDRLAAFNRLGDWLSINGIIAICEPSGRSDYGAMMQSQGYDISSMPQLYKDVHSSTCAFGLDIIKSESSVRTEDLDSAYRIAEFMFNWDRHQEKPDAKLMKDYINEHFRDENGFSYSINHDILLARKVKQTKKYF